MAQVCRCILSCLCSLLFCLPLFSQVVTPQDCPGAIPICQNSYTTTQAYNGEGAVPDEINSNISCLKGNSSIGSGEKNDVWYTFTVQNNGVLGFVITPNSPSDDYDWAVYNLTGKGCADIRNDQSMEVSCNFSAKAGSTGPNGGSGLNSQDAAGTSYNATIPVSAGQTYVINISNFSQTQSGYTIDFSTSSAANIDQSPPKALSVANPGCGANQLVLTFSENILCSTVQASDFTFTGPGGSSYAVTGITSAECAAGADYGKVYTVTVSPPISTAGTYDLNLVGPVTDLCSNPAVYPSKLSFSLNLLSATTSTTPTNCNLNDGTAGINVSGGAAPYIYSWSPVSAATSSISNLASGNYIVTVTDANNCSLTKAITVENNVTINVLTPASDTICPGEIYQLSATPTGGTAPYSYSWSHSLGNQQMHNVTPNVTTTYMVLVTDANGCTSVPKSTKVSVATPVVVTLAASQNLCLGDTVRIKPTISGGDGSYTYAWNPGGETTPFINASPIANTNYDVTVTDGCGSNTTANVMVNVNEIPVPDFTVDIQQGCPTLCVNFTDNSIVNGGNVVKWKWLFSDGGVDAVKNPTHCFSSPGAYNVTLIATSDKNCVDTISKGACVIVHNKPKADFDYTPSNGSISMLDPRVVFTDASYDASSWFWFFGDPNDSTVSNEQNPSHSYLDTGYYCVKLRAVTQFGCKDSVFDCFTIKPDWTFYIPQTFTPNGDNLNDLFQPLGSNLNSFQMTIYNRWGQIIYRGNDLKNTWNGRYQNTGAMSEIGVYVYDITIVDINKVSHRYVGHVSLIR